MDAHLDPSDILNLFTDLAEKNAIHCKECILSAQQDILQLQAALSKKDCWVSNHQILLSQQHYRSILFPLFYDQHFIDVIDFYSTIHSR